MHSHNFKDLTGKIFGRITVIKLDKILNYKTYWLCKCICGNIKSILGMSLSSKKTKSCGCYNLDSISKRNVTHKLSKSNEYRIWVRIKDRCYNIKSSIYSYYGGRGITMCNEWKNSFEQFYKDMGPRPSKEFSIDRIDNDKGYSKDNCRWATRSIQCFNQRKRKNSFGKYFGVSKVGNIFVANIHKDKVKYYVGSFKTEKEAALAFNKKSIELYGIYAKINDL